MLTFKSSVGWMQGANVLVKSRDKRVGREIIIKQLPLTTKQPVIEF